MTHLIEVFLLSMVPISELRGAIPLGIVQYNLPIWQVFFVSILGNTLVPFCVLFALEKSPFIRKIYKSLCEGTKKKHSKKFEIYRNMALITLVAIPFPLTGAWTASLCAFIFNIPKLLACGLIFIGLLIAGVIVTLLTLGIINI